MMLVTGLYQVKEFTGNTTGFEATVLLDESHPIFRGHFPGNPILPGVCSLQVIQELLETHLDKKLWLTSSSNVKFLAIINPKENPSLHLTCQVTESAESVKIKSTISIASGLALKADLTFGYIAN